MGGAEPAPGTTKPLMTTPTEREAAGTQMATWRNRDGDTAPAVTVALDDLLHDLLATYALSLQAAPTN